MSLTGVSDLDIYIMSWMSDATLSSFIQCSKNIYKLYGRDDLWKSKCERLYGDLVLTQQWKSLPSNFLLTWKEYYIQIQRCLSGGPRTLIDVVMDGRTDLMKLYDRQGIEERFFEEIEDVLVAHRGNSNIRRHIVVSSNMINFMKEANLGTVTDDPRSISVKKFLTVTENGIIRLDSLLNVFRVYQKVNNIDHIWSDSLIKKHFHEVVNSPKYTDGYYMYIIYMHNTKQINYRWDLHLVSEVENIFLTHILTVR